MDVLAVLWWMLGVGDGGSEKGGTRRRVGWDVFIARKGNEKATKRK